MSMLRVMALGGGRADDRREREGKCKVGKSFFEFSFFWGKYTLKFVL